MLGSTQLDLLFSPECSHSYVWNVSILFEHKEWPRNHVVLLRETFLKETDKISLVIEHAYPFLCSETKVGRLFPPQISKMAQATSEEGCCSFINLFSHLWIKHLLNLHYRI